MKPRKTSLSEKGDSYELEKLIQNSCSSDELKKTKKPGKMKRLKFLWLLLCIPTIAGVLLICGWFLLWSDLDLPVTTKIWAQAVNLGWLDVRAAVDGSNVIDMNLVIAGLARDTAPTLPRLLLHLEDVICSFKSVLVLVFEDGSKDNTRDVLNRWAQRAIRQRLCVGRMG